MQNLLQYCNKQKIVAALIDPDKTAHLTSLIALANEGKVDLFLVGGSLLSENNLANVIDSLKTETTIPVILFPGNGMQLNSKADGVLFLTMLSGRNPEYLIGQQVAAAPIIHQMNLAVFSTAYLLIDGGKMTTTQYITHTFPIPQDKPNIAVATALAASMMGMQHCYLEAGSGALFPVSTAIISAVKKTTNTIIIVGGGIRNKTAMNKAFEAGADVVVIGSAFEAGEFSF